jgi:hypothetical protein
MTMDGRRENTPKGVTQHSPGLPGEPGNPGLGREKNVNP